MSKPKPVSTETHTDGTAAKDGLSGVTMQIVVPSDLYLKLVDRAASHPRINSPEHIASLMIFEGLRRTED